MAEHDKITPYLKEETAKKEQVAEMFDNISHSYDFLNHFLSMGIDKWWRRKVMKLLKMSAPKQILDVATGTGDLALAALGANPDKVIGIDISGKMLEVGKKKILRKNLSDKIEMIQGDAENLPFGDQQFDAVLSAFGVRNFGDLNKGLSEMSRVLKVGGRALILEFSIPKNVIFRNLYYFYFCNVLPFIGKMVSKDSRAYSYLPESVRAFPDGDKMAGILKNCGFKKVQCIPLTFGISTIYWAEK
ncbi:MAG: bifunctional demethylmenaquinone methyltransferase/2-methoxy-6-polyprenyl-1,4-benzoquinol methylase UbiE [Chitinophagales bacterium]